MKRIAIFGSTGSIGRQALEVIAAFPDRFSARLLLAGSNAPLLQEQIGRFLPETAGLAFPPAGYARPAVARFLQGPDALEQACELDGYDAALVAVVGVAGLRAVCRLLERGIPVLLANKEALVAGGGLVMGLARRTGTPLLPVDSEHSAIFQCLQARGNNAPAKLVLTASGGPFRGLSRQELARVTPDQALRHPNWSMGRKITVDSASMMNKALEVIEAAHLFSMPPERIQVVVHRESIVHSAVEFADGALLAQLGLADMRLPIAYAMSYPERLPLPGRRLDLTALNGLHFERPDEEAFPAVRLGHEALRLGGVAPAALNGANERCVELFLAGKLAFPDIAELAAAAMRRAAGVALTLENALAADAEARAYVQACAKPA